MPEEVKTLETKEEKFSYVCKVMDLKGDTEDKKHGYYKVLEFEIYKLSWDSWNGNYYLKVNGSHVLLEDYKEIIFKEVRKTWDLPSFMDDIKIADLLDYLYMYDNRIREFYRK